MSEIQRINIDEHNKTMSNMSKDTKRFQIPYNSIQTKLDRFWTSYSKFTIRFTWLILILSALITIGLSICFLFFVHVRRFDETTFFIQNGRALRNVQRIQKLFGNDKNFRVHQQMNLYPALDIIIRRKLPKDHRNMNETNMLNKEIIDEIRLLDKKIQEISISDTKNKSLKYNFLSLCAIINSACSVDGNYLLSDRFRDEISQLKYKRDGIYFDSFTGANGIGPFIFGKVYQVKNVTLAQEDYDDESEGSEDEVPVTPEVTEIISHVPIFRLRYSLNITTDEKRHLSMLWETEAMRYLNENFQSDLISLSVTSSTAISDTVSKQARDEGPFIAIMLLIFIIFACFFVSIQGNFHTSVGYLSIFGIISLILSSGATFGLLSLFQIEIIEPMALIVYVITIIECMRISIVCGEYHRVLEKYMPQSSTNISTKIDIEKILSSIFKSSRPYLLSSTIIQMIVYIIISLISPMPCIKYLTITIVVYVFVNYLTNCTFFSSCLTITLKRVKSRRHCLWCYHLPSDYHTKDRKKSINQSFFQKGMQCIEKIDPKLKKIVTGLICLLTVICVVLSIWSIILIDTRLFDDRFLPRNSSLLRSYMKSQNEDYDIGPVVMFVIPETLDYSDKKNQYYIHHIVEQCHNETTTNTFTLLWTKHESVDNLLTSKDPLHFRISPYSQNDIILGEENNKTVIKASRFYCQYKTIRGDREDLRTMNNIYTFAEQSPLPSIFPFSVIFLHYEALGQIRFEIYLLLLIVGIVSFIISFVMFTSLRKALLIFLHLTGILSGSLACLHVFHNLSFNFANAPWFYTIPIVYLDTIIHATFNIKRSKWKYNRIIFSLIIALIIFSFFPIETYIFHLICYSLIYQSVICFISINITLPSWLYFMRKIFKKNKQTKRTPTVIAEKNQSSAAVTEIQNLVYESNGINI